jgi:predicted GIY-YIG superfamily endonuclease
MANFNNGKIYALRNHINDLVFVGNTTQSLSLRLAQHKSDYTLTTIKTHKIYQAIKVLGFHSFYI